MSPSAGRVADRSWGRPGQQRFPSADCAGYNVVPVVLAGSQTGARARKSKDRALAAMAVERVEAAQKRIEAINTELRQIDGAVVNDGG